MDVLDEDTGLQRKSTSIDLEVHSVGFYSFTGCVSTHVSLVLCLQHDAFFELSFTGSS